MFQISPTAKALVILSMIAFGIVCQKEAAAVPPDLKNLYFAEQNAVIATISLSQS